MTEAVLPNLNPGTAGLLAATEANLNFSEKRAGEEAKEARTLTNSNTAYARGQNLRAEPQKLRANAFNANTAGLAESGQLARTQGLTETDYAQKQGRLAEQRRTAINKITTGETNKDREIALKRGEAIAKANQEQDQYLIANAPEKVATPTAATALPQAKLTSGELESPPQVVSSKPQPSSNGPRKSAISKIKRGWGVG